MNRKQIISIALSTGLALAAGYWWGHSTATVGPELAPTGADSTTVATEGSADAEQPRRVLYYRNPMGLNDTSPVPKKDSMGMDYIPVYEGDAPDGPQVRWIRDEGGLPRIARPGDPGPYLEDER